MGLPSVGDGAPLVTTPHGVPSDPTMSYPCRGTRRPRATSPTRVRSGALSASAGERRTPDEVAGLVELDRTAEARVVRRRLGGQLVAVQRHAGLKAQRVARGQPAGPQVVAARLGHRLPDRHGVARGDEQLEAVLAGVAGPRDQRVDPGDRAGQDRVVLQVGERGVGEPGQDLLRLRSLDGDQRVRVGPVVDGRLVEPLGPLDQLGEHGPSVRGVGHDQISLGRQPVDDQVVQHAAVGVADHRVARPADRERRQVPDERVVERGAGLRPGEEDLPHVGQVEQSRARTDGLVLGGLTAVAQRHQVAGELGDGGAEVVVDVVEWGLLGVRNGHRGRLLIAQTLAYWRAHIVPPVRGVRSRRLPLCHRCLRASPWIRACTFGGSIAPLSRGRLTHAVRFA